MTWGSTCLATTLGRSRYAGTPGHHHGPHPQLEPLSNSSPVEGITRAINTFWAPDRKISLYVFGDEFTGASIEAVIDTVDRINRGDGSGQRRVRIHGVGFPVQFAARPSFKIRESALPP